MLITLRLYADTDKDRLETEKEITDILKKTSDYQHRDVMVTSDNINYVGDCVDVDFFIKDCTDLGHTRGSLDELFQYLRKEFL